uniref:GH02584p n=1 Tax=Drosophila melanogaster TaxID=7227 RepID=Q9W5F9_DROME|nr:GH02584p [Drosophila melanogaster]ABY20473.1 IP21832p [Drosophila melanogaster]ACD81841.1 IP21932p [Drosophila melanogaster]
MVLSSELLQDALRSSNKLLFECYGSLIRCYQECVELRKDNKDRTKSQDYWDAEFVGSVIKQLAEMVRRSQEPEKLLEENNSKTVRPLVTR